jgi:mannosyltransferase OCH1-like enzyme
MIKTYKDLKGRTWDQPGIPKWIFRTGNESVENLHPVITQMYINQLQNNPGYELFYFDEKDRLEFIKDQNNSDIHTAYNKFVPISYKADLFKFTIAYMYGGICMDFSMESLVPLDTVLKNYTEVLAKDTDAPNGVCVGFIASVKDTILLRTTIEKCVDNAKNDLYGTSPLDVTGPVMFGNIYKKLNNTDDVIVGKITDNVHIYNMADQTYIYDHDLPIVKIRSSNHYSILYSDKKDNLYYGDLWQSGNIYTPKIKSYKHLKGRVWQGEGIPKWIYRSGSFALNALPEIVKSIYNLEIIDKNPDYELFYFDDEECRQFIKEEWGEDYVVAYDTLIPTAYKCDLFRYLLLYTYGGIWGDFTQIPLVPFDELISNVDRVFCLDHPAGQEDIELYNAVMMVKPKDIVVKNAITISMGNITGRKYCENPLDITGPVVLGQAFRSTEFHRSSFSKRISLGKFNNTKIILNPNLDPFVVDEFGKLLFLKKISNHKDILYTKVNKHYYTAWIDKTVYNV